MPNRDRKTDQNRLERAVAEARRERERRACGFREQALRLFPWVCAHCGREFTRANLRELTVHHKDHDHDNNPPDGSNWELLCLYCHEREHDHGAETGDVSPLAHGTSRENRATYKPFAELDSLLKKR